MLNPKLRENRSNPSNLSLLGNNAETKEYPGIKIDKARPRTILIGVSFKCGTEMNSNNKRVDRMVSLRSRKAIICERSRF